MNKNWVCIVRMDKIFGLMATYNKEKESWSIHGFETKAQGLAHFESAYSRAHQRGYESRMSACLSYMYFEASIVKLDLETIRNMIEQQIVKQASHISGFMDFIPLITSKAKLIWESGAKPKLID